MSSPEGRRVVQQLRHDVDDIFDLLSTVADTQRRHTAELGEVREVLQQQSGRLDQLDDRLDQLDGRLDQQSGRLDQLDDRLDQLDGRLDRLDGRLGGIEEIQQQILDLLRRRQGGDADR